MKVNFKDKELEIKFGLGQLVAIDQELGLSVQEVNLGEGLEMLVPKLKAASVIAIAKMLGAVTKGQKGAPKNMDELEELVIAVQDQYGSLQEFAEACIEELGKRPLTREIVKQAEQ